jgi:hypothetical protein
MVRTEVVSKDVGAKENGAKTGIAQKTMHDQKGLGKCKVGTPHSCEGLKAHRGC